jgi:hypothetical protein
MLAMKSICAILNLGIFTKIVNQYSNLFDLLFFSYALTIFFLQIY